MWDEVRECVLTLLVNTHTPLPWLGIPNYPLPTKGQDEERVVINIFSSHASFCESSKCACVAVLLGAGGGGGVGGVKQL